MSSYARVVSLVVGWALGVGLGGLGGCHPGPVRPSAPATCAEQKLEPCARALQAAGAAADVPALRERAASYLALAQARNGGAGWVELYAALQSQRRAKPGAEAATILVADRLAAARVSEPAALAKVAVLTQDLGEPAGLPASELLNLLATAAGFEHVVWVHGAAVWQLFPADPLQPFMGGLAPITRADDTLAHLAATVTLAQTLRAALQAASGFHYREAAALADQLAVQAGLGSTPSEPALRALYGLQLLGAAGIALPGDPRPSVATEPSFPVAPTDTPYGDLLRVRLVAAKARSSEWTGRRANIVRGMAADRQADFDALMAPGPTCRSQRLLPMATVRDLIFGHQLGSTLAPADVTPAAGQLPLPEWQHRYQTLVDLVAATGSAWAYLPNLLRQRGPAPEASVESSRTYQKVTELALAHLRASRALQQSAPTRYQLLSQFELVSSAGLRADPPLLAAMLELSESSVRSRLAPPADAAAILEGSLWAAVVGITYPADLRAGYFASLHTAISARLRGDLEQQTGWAVAGLYALDELYRRATGAPPQLAVNTQQLVRALSDPGLVYPELAGLTQAAALYIELVIENALDPNAVGEPAHFSEPRQVAYQALTKALRTFGASPASVETSRVAEDLAQVADGTLALFAAAIHAKSKPDSQCKDEAVVARPPELRAALDKLRALRLRLLGPGARAATGPSQLRTQLVIQVLSDLLDISAREDGPARFAIGAEAAEKNLRDGLQTWPLGTGAALLSQGYRLLRDYLAQPAAHRQLTLGPEQTRELLTRLHSFVTASVRAGNRLPLLTTLAQLDWNKIPTQNLAQVAAGLAHGLYAQQQPQQAGIFLLSAALLDTGDAAATRAELETAAPYDRALAETVRFLLDTQSYRLGRAPTPAAYTTALRQAAEPYCQEGGTAQVLTLLQAASDFARGKSARARTNLHHFLTDAEAHGLTVPRVNYQFEEKSGTVVFNFGYSLSYGAGVLNASKDFKLSLGMSAAVQSESKLTTTFDARETIKADQEAARYFVYGAALLTVYEFLDGSAAAAEQVAALTLAASDGSWQLGGRGASASGVNLAYDARGVLAVAAQLAAEAGLPILAGRLWRRVYDTLNADTDEQAALAMLAPLPTGLAGVAALQPLLPRVRASLQALVRQLPCQRRGQPREATLEVACAEYPVALARSLGSSGPRPRLPSQSACGAWSALDQLMRTAASESKESASERAALRAAAVEPQLAAKHEIEAALLLQPLPGCDEATVALGRRVSGLDQVPSSLRQQLLVDVIQCSTMSKPDPQLDRDLLQLDAVSRRLPGDTMHFRVLQVVASRTRTLGDWTALRKLTTEPDFLRRFDAAGGGVPVLVAVVLQYLVPASAGQLAVVPDSQSRYELLCQSFALTNPTRRTLCDELQRWRTPPGPSADGSAAALRRRADESLRILTGLSF